MTLNDDIEREVKDILRFRWNVQAGRVVPAPESLGLGNDARTFDEATVLYADMTASTALVDAHDPEFAAEVYRSYLVSAARIIKSEGGAITAYDGDRVMAVFIGDTKNSSAARTGLKINHAVTKIINPAIKAQYSQKNYTLRHVVGIDTSSLFVARIGVRNDNDLVWVGRAANHAAKMSAINEPGYGVYISDAVFKRLMKEVKYSSDGNGELMWEQRSWKAMGGLTIYRSGWTWAV